MDTVSRMGYNCPPWAIPPPSRAALFTHRGLSGPAILQEHGTTTTMFPGDTCKVMPSGELIIEVGGVK